MSGWRAVVGGLSSTVKGCSGALSGAGSGVWGFSLGSKRSEKNFDPAFRPDFASRTHAEIQYSRPAITAEPLWLGAFGLLLWLRDSDPALLGSKGMRKLIRWQALRLGTFCQ